MSNHHAFVRKLSKTTDDMTYGGYPFCGGSFETTNPCNSVPRNMGQRTKQRGKNDIRDWTKSAAVAKMQRFSMIFNQLLPSLVS